MKANTDRAQRFAFDIVAEQYDNGRPRFDLTLVNRALLWCSDGSTPKQVLEIGAGTGQLTRALVLAGLKVVALEPGRFMSRKLRHNLGSAIAIHRSTFEDFNALRPFDAIFAANSFHWLDPSISYSKSRTLLRPDGHLVLLWNFPIVADADLQRRLNATVFVGAWRDMAKDPDGYLAGVRRLLAEGRAELKATGCFLPPRWGILKRTRTLDVQLYAQWLSSLSNTAANWDDMAKRVRAALLGEDSIRILDYVYMSAARRR